MWAYEIKGEMKGAGKNQMNTVKWKMTGER